MIPRIPEFDNSQAVKEGWSIFTCDGSDNGPYQLQCCDDDDVFEKDVQAWQYVVQCAKGGSEYHKKALDYLREHNPAEIMAMQRIFGSLE
jgi:hypothetical protein